MCAYLIFRSPQVQTWLAKRTASYFSRELNTKVSVEGLDISWFFDIELEEFRMNDHRDSTLIYSHSLIIDVNNINPRLKSIAFNEISVNYAEVYLRKYTDDSTFNYHFLSQYFSGETKSTTSPWKINLRNLKLNNCTLVYKKDKLSYTTDLPAQSTSPDIDAKSVVKHSINTSANQNQSNYIDFNDLKLYNVNLDARNISTTGDSITVDIRNFSLYEQSGFNLHQLMGSFMLKDTELKIDNLKIKTPGSDINTNITFNYKNPGALSNFIDSVLIESKFEPSILDLNELRYFAKNLNGMENTIFFNGMVRGKLASLKARSFHFSFGNNSSFDGDISLDGLPDINETFIHLKVKKLATDYYDLANIRLPGGTYIELPDEAKNVGRIDIKGFFTGFIYDFVASANFMTAAGILETDLSLKTGKQNSLNYSGEFNLKDWDIGKTLEISDKVGIVSINSSVNGSIINKQHNNVSLVAVVEKAELLNNEFNDIRINGKLEKKKFTGNLSMHDELAKLEFNGLVDFTEKIPVINFKAVLQDAYLTELNLWKHDSTSRLSTTMDLNFVGSNIDNLLGYLRFDSTMYYEKGKAFFIKNINLRTEEISSQTKKLSLNSDLIDASFYGVFSFGDFFHSIRNIMGFYLPSLHLTNGEQKSVEQKQLFDYNIQIKNATPLTEIFLPEFTLNSEASIYGNYNSEDNVIILNGRAGQFIYRNVRFEKWYIRGKNAGASIQLASGVSKIAFLKDINEQSKGATVENFLFKAFMQGDSVKYNLVWDDVIPDDYNTGNIEGYLSFSRFPQIYSRFDKFDLQINDRLWVASQNEAVIIDSSSVYIPSISITSNEQRMKLSGRISNNADDILALSFEELDVSNADLMLNVKNVDFDGFLTGTFLLRDLYKTQKIEAQVEIKDFSFNKEKMGDVVINSIWNHDISALDINCDIIYHGNISTHKPISAKGLIYTSKRPEGNFDLDVKVFNYKLASLNPFLRGIASNINGFARGDLRMLGTFNKPIITGELELMRAQMKIDYLNVTYSFADKVIAEADHIMANNITVYDSLGNTGILDFSLKHQNFRNIRMNIDIAANKMNTLNTTFKDNNLFYGRAFGTGKVNISGSFKDVSIRIDAKSENNTNVYIPINLAVNAEESNFIRFKTPEDTPIPDKNIYIPSETGTDVNMNLQVTNDANIQLFLPENIGNIKGSGNGNIQIGLNKQGEMSMYGDYVMEKGSFLFTLGNVINRVFDIRDGSKISFKGSPYEADIDLNAVYRVKASLKGLTEEYTGSSIPVDCIIKLKNNLYNPDISFSINLPETNNELNQLVFAEFDTTNQVIMTQQIVSLLVLKTFAFNRTPDFTTSVSSSSIEVLTDQLSNMLSQIIKDVDIGVKYRTGSSTLTDEEVEVALSTNLFNDRVSIDGNVGMYTQGTTENASNIVGDVVVDVKITPDGRFRVKAFNKSNPFEMSAIPMSPYKQGIGVYYRYEFDKFSDIFERKKKEDNVLKDPIDWNDSVPLQPKVQDSIPDKQPTH